VSFGRVKVLRQTAARVDDELRLERAQALVSFERIPAFPPCHRRGDVVPEDIDLSVLREQFRGHAFDVVEKPNAGVQIHGTPPGIRMMPVHQREIEPDLEIEPPTGIHVFPNNITSGSVVDGVERVDL